MAGRPKGAKDKNPRNSPRRTMAEFAGRMDLTPDQIMNRMQSMTSLTPLEIMMGTAMFAWQIADEMQTKGEAKEEILKIRIIASTEAGRAAPYCHPKLATETHRVITDDANRTEADLEREFADIERRGKAAANPAGTVAPPVPKQPPGVVH